MDVHRVQQNRVTGVEQIVSLLLGVAVADSDPFVRHSAASVLTAPYDTYAVAQSCCATLQTIDPFTCASFRFLCQPDHVSSLCVALQDELFETRETVLLTLSRLAPRNPAVVFPVLRSLMLRLLSELGILGCTTLILILTYRCRPHGGRSCARGKRTPCGAPDELWARSYTAVC